MAERILMIDDDARLAVMVADYLGGAGFRLAVAAKRDPSTPRCALRSG